MAARHPTVFLAHDYMLSEVLDQIAAGLAERRVRVVRGPVTVPGPKLVYDVPDMRARLRDVEVAVFSSRSVCGPELMDAMPRLRGIVNPTVGLETVDVGAATARGILVGHAATLQNRTALSEATVMLILMQLYQPDRAREVMDGRRPRPRALLAERWARILAGRTVGLVGFGRIGREVARRLAGFGVRVLACGRPGAPPPDDLPDHVAFVALDELLAGSDIVSLHVTPASGARPVMGAREFALMKPGARLINTARGQAVDEGALCEALSSGRLGGAALDTFEVEPLPADSPLWTLDNVYLTPHLVAQTYDGLSVLPGTALENIDRLLRGELPLYCKNPEAEPAWRRRLDAMAGPEMAGPFIEER